MDACDERVAAIDCPYIGLSPFDREHERYFFGRDDDARLIASHVVSGGITVLQGASGVGKSSVLGAALPRALKEIAPGALIVPFSRWDLGFYDCLQALASGLIAAELAQRGPPSGTGEGETSEAGKKAINLEALAREWGRDPTGPPLIFVFDQFEQYFTGQDYGTGSGDKRFEADLARIIQRRDLGAHVLISIRADALSELNRLRSCIPNILTRCVALESLDSDAACEAIIGPLEKWREDHREGPVEVDPALIQELISQVLREGTQQIDTPYLQLALTKLWWREREQNSQVLHSRSLRDLGGATGIADRHFMETMGSLDDEERRLCAVIFARMVTPSGMKIALSADDLAKMLEENRDQVEAVLEKLDSGASRIIHRVQPPQGAARFEIFHDVLSGPILKWVATEQDRIAHEEKLDQERRKAEADRRAADREHQRQQEELAKQQIQLAREKRLKKRSYRIAMVAGFACLLALGTAGWAITKHHEARAQRGRALATQAEHLLEAGDRRTALLLALEALPRGRSPLESARNWLYWPDKDYAFRVLDRALTTASLGRDLQLGQDRITFVGFDKKGRMATASKSGGIDIWPAEAVDQLTAWADIGELPHIHLQHERPPELQPDVSIAITSVAFGSADRMVTADRSGFVYLWEIGEKRPLAKWSAAARGPVFASISPDGAFIATASFDDRKPRLWAADGTEVPVPWKASHDKPITSVSFDADGKRLVTASFDGTAAIWNMADGRLLRVQHGEGIMAARLSPDGTRLVTGGGWGTTTARIWQLNPQAATVASLTLKQEPLILQHDKPISAVDFDATGRQIVTASQDGGVRIWNAETGAMLVRVQGPAQAGGRPAAALSPDGRKLIANFGEDQTYIWQLYGQVQMPRVAKLPQGVVAISTDRDATRVAVVSQTNVEIFGSQGQLLRSLDSELPPLAAAMSPDGRYVAVAAGRTVRLWSTDESARDIVLPETRSLVLSLAFDPAGKRLAIATQDGSLHLSATSNARLGDALVLAPHDPITALVFTHDGGHVYAGSTQGRIHVVDTGTWRELPDPGLSLRDRAILTLDFAPGGRHLVANAVDPVATPQELELVGRTTGQRSPFLKAPVILDVTPSQMPESEISLRRYLDALQATNVLVLGSSKAGDNGTDLRQQQDEWGDRVIVVPVDKMFRPAQGLPLPEDTYGRISYASKQVRQLPEKYRKLNEQERCAYGLKLDNCEKQTAGLR